MVTADDVQVMLWLEPAAQCSRGLPTGAVIDRLPTILNTPDTAVTLVFSVSVTWTLTLELLVPGTPFQTYVLPWLASTLAIIVCQAPPSIEYSSLTKFTFEGLPLIVHLNGLPLEAAGTLAPAAGAVTVICGRIENTAAEVEVTIEVKSDRASDTRTRHCSDFSLGTGFQG